MMDRNLRREEYGPAARARAPSSLEVEMRKVTLDVDALRVDSFATGDAQAARGTVRGHDTRYTEFCNTRSCGVYTHCCLAGEEAKAAEPQEPFE
jgi:hypothetical protein